MLCQPLHYSPSRSWITFPVCWNISPLRESILSFLLWIMFLVFWCTVIVANVGSRLCNCPSSGKWRQPGRLRRTAHSLTRKSRLLCFLDSALRKHCSRHITWYGVWIALLLHIWTHHAEGSWARVAMSAGSRICRNQIPTSASLSSTSAMSGTSTGRI